MHVIAVAERLHQLFQDIPGEASFVFFFGGGGLKYQIIPVLPLKSQSNKKNPPRLMN